jgi:hypothetical protein
VRILLIALLPMLGVDLVAREVPLVDDIAAAMARKDLARTRVENAPRRSWMLDWD